MWGLAFGALVAVVACGAASVMALAVWVRQGSAAPLHAALGWVVLSTGLSVLAGAGVTLIAPMLQEAREHHKDASVRAWVGRWLLALHEWEAAVPSPLPIEAQTALLFVKEKLQGEEAEALKDVAERYDLGSLYCGFLHDRSEATRLDALEAIAKLKAPESLQALAGVMARDERPAVRRAAARAAARTLSEMPQGPTRDKARSAFADALGAASLGTWIEHHCLELAGEQGHAIALDLLSRDSSAPGLRRAALLVAARAHDRGLVRWIAAHLRYPDAEVRAAALRALRVAGVAPKGLSGLVVPLLQDEAIGVRVQAAHAAALLPERQALGALWRALGDSAWPVRLAAARSIAAFDRADERLALAATRHPDPFARCMASAVLRGA